MNNEQKQKLIEKFLVLLTKKVEKSELDLLSKEFLKMEEFDDISYDLGLKLKLW